MLDRKSFITAVEQLNEDKNIPKKAMIEALEEAFVKTYHTEFDPEAELRVEINLDKGFINLFHLKKIVESVDDELTEISLEEAKKINSDYQIGDKHEIEIPFTEEFSALAALKVKQILRQKIRETERGLILDEYTNRIGDMIRGNIEKAKEHFYIVAFDKTFGFLNKHEVPRDLKLTEGDSVKAVITSIDANSKGVPIILSMNSVEYIKRILEAEIPEIKDGKIIVDKIARYGGVRTKMIVKSSQEGLDPVGTIVGPSGSRIQRIIEEVGREFIDVIPVREDLDKQIARAFVPARPIYVKIEEPEDKNDKAKAIVVVKEEDFSSAIGRGGSNAKVVSRLLDIEIDVVKEADVDFKIPSGFTYGDQRPPTNNRRSNDIDASKYMIEEDQFAQDEIFDEGFEVQEDNNFGFEEVADIPEIDDFEGFADENYFEDEAVNTEEPIEDSDYDKYYE